MYKRILIPLAEQALPHAIAHAEHFRAELLSSVLAPLWNTYGLTGASAEWARNSSAGLTKELLESMVTAPAMLVQAQRNTI